MATQVPVCNGHIRDAASANGIHHTDDAHDTRGDRHNPGRVEIRNSLAMIIDYVPGSYYTHDQLHVRGGHQVSWAIDGVPIPNTNIASNLGPQVNPNDIDVLETMRGSYSIADYGDRTYGIFNVAPRTGFERNNEAELVLSAGNFYQTDDQLNFGSHTNRFAYYASLNGNRTDLGLQTPTSAVIHDQANGYGGFTSMTYNLDSSDQLRLVAQLRQDYYQVPFDPNDPNTAGQFLSDSNKEKDGYVLFSWVRTFSPGLVLTVSPFYHYNSVNYASSPDDQPSSATENIAASYEGGQANLSWIKQLNNLRAGVYGFAEQTNQLFGLLCNSPGNCQNVEPPATVGPTGGQAAVYAEDQFKLTSWLSLNAGLRQTLFWTRRGECHQPTRRRIPADPETQLGIPGVLWTFLSGSPAGDGLRSAAGRGQQSEFGFYTPYMGNATRNINTASPFLCGAGRSMPTIF